MTQDEDFQYVVSKEDYHDLKNTKVKCQQLTQLLSEVQTVYSQDKKSYLDKIEVLEQELRSYKVSVRQYVDRQIKQIDGLLKMLNDYRSFQEGSSLNLSSIDKIRSECDKISQQFTISLKDLQIINCEVITVIRNLVSDSLSLHEKLKDYQEMYDEALEQKEDLYGKIRALNEKNIFLEKEKEKSTKGEERLKYQNQILKFSVKQKQSQNLQLEIDLHNHKNQHNEEISILKEESLQKERKLKETLQASKRELKESLIHSENDKNIMRRYLTQEIQSLREKIENMLDQLEIKKRQLKHMEVALQQHKLLKQQAQQDIQRFKNNFQQKEQNLLNQIQKLKDHYEGQIQKMQGGFEQKERMSMSVIEDMDSMLQKQAVTREKLQNDMREMRNNESKLVHEIQEYKSSESRYMNQIEEHKEKLNIERESFKSTYVQMREELQEKTMRLNEIEENIRSFRLIQGQYEQRYVDQRNTIQEMTSQLENSSQHISQLQTKLKIKAQQLLKMEYDANKNQHLSHEIQQLRKVIALSESQKNVLQQNAHSLTEQLNKFKKLFQQSLKKLTNQNQQLIIQLKITVQNLENKKQQTEEVIRDINEIKIAKNNIENQYCQLADIHEKEKRVYQEELSESTNQLYMLKQTLEEKQLMQQNLLKEIDALRAQVKNIHSAQQASNLLRMDLQALQNEVQRLCKQKTMIKKERQSLSEDLSQSRMESKFLNQQLNSMKIYIDQLEQNLQKLSQEKSALRNQIHLFKEQAQFCKRESIQQLGIIDHLERNLQSTRKQLKTVSESNDPLSIVRRSSLSKGEKAYYVKEMILEYGNEMKKNLESIGALSPDEIRDLIASELRELGNYVKKLQRQY